MQSTELQLWKSPGLCAVAQTKHVEQPRATDGQSPRPRDNGHVKASLDHLPEGKCRELAFAA